MCRPMTYAFTQDVHHTSLGDLTQQSVQKPCALDPLIRQPKGVAPGLSSLQEGQQLHGTWSLDKSCDSVARIPSP